MYTRKTGPEPPSRLRHAVTRRLVLAGYDGFALHFRLHAEWANESRRIAANGDEDDEEVFQFSMGQTF